MASILEISPSIDRFFNVFGPAPDSERETPAIQSASGGPNVNKSPEYFL
jgi:serine/threonine-protein phosphatase PPG1